MTNKIMKRINTLLMMCMLAVTPLLAADGLTLKDIASGAFRAERMTEMEPAQDGETYLAISRDGQRIEQFSFKTGKNVGTLVDLATARGRRSTGWRASSLAPTASVSCFRRRPSTSTAVRSRPSITFSIYVTRSTRPFRLQAHSVHRSSRLTVSRLPSCAIITSSS